MANLALKYRPQEFSDVVEQSNVVKILEAMCEQENLPNRNFLLIGPRGCGKTTLGRIIARKLNEGVGTPIELDAASHSGVDTVRELVQQAHQYPIGQKYKVFICDECFSGDTWVRTPSGLVQIRDIVEGDRICNLTGTSTVTHLFKNRVKINNLVSLQLGESQIITTKDHLFFTDDGWVKAKDLEIGEYLYDYKMLQRMRESVSSTISQRSKNALQQGMQKSLDESETFCSLDTIRKVVSDLWEDVLDNPLNQFHNLWESVRRNVEETTRRYGTLIQTTCSALAYIYVSCMWENDGDTEQRSSNSLFFKMCESDIRGEASKDTTKYMRMVWKFIRSQLEFAYKEDMQRSMPICVDSVEAARSEIAKIFRSYENEQPHVQSGNCIQDVENSREEWYLTSAACYAWWERPIHSTADSFERSIRGAVDIRISGENKYSEEQQSESVSYSIQTRPSLSGETVRNRGGWCRPQYEIATIARRKESELFGKFRVDSVEVYKSGDNDQLFLGSFKNSEIHGEYVDLYDLEVEGHPSYYVNDVLVHNCHSFSNTAWQALLLTIEEQPAKSVFILLTTNPEKIPATIISRVQVFQLSNISLSGIESRLKYVIEQENNEGRTITYEDSAISFIAKLAKGGMRDALTLLDKALVYSEDITSESLKYSLNIPEYDDYFDLLNAYAKKDYESVMRIVDKVYNSGTNFVKWFEGFQSFVINLAKYVLLKDINQTMIPSYYESKVKKYGMKHAQICLSLSQVLVELIAKISRTEYMEEVAVSYLCQRS